MGDPDAPLIAVLALIVIGLPVVLGIASSMFKTWVGHRETMAGAITAQAAEQTAQQAARTERLEQRVRVLERIVTDRGLTLGDEIERLRVEPPLDRALGDAR